MTTLPTLTATSLPYRDDFDGNTMDHWRCTLTYKGRRMTVKYSMGFGHNGKEPEAVGVLGSLFSDASCSDSARDYQDFARDLGYGEDSIKGLKTYKACQSIAIRLHKLLGSDYDTLQEQVQEAGY